MQLGDLKRVDLRKIWANEAMDFTPWISSNIEHLGEVMGMDLEVTSIEAPTGDFSLDVLVRDVGRNRVVVIENQLTPTDHDHCGKLITYASGYDATTIVWIASEFREEHRQALDWLNQRTDRDTEFFGIVVEALQIDESNPAINFRLVATPNEWRKSKVGIVTGGNVSPRSESYRKFFQVLIDELREKHRFTNARVGQPQSWFLFSSGTGGLNYGASFAQGGRLRTEVYIDVGEKEKNEEIFDCWKKEQEQIELEYGLPLSWEPLQDKRACRVAIYMDGSIDANEDKLNQYKEWYVNNLLKFKSVFTPRFGKIIW